MGRELTRRQSLGLVGASAVALGIGGGVLGDSLTRRDCATGSVTRVATTVIGAEFTGLFVTGDGTLFCNVAHPDSTNEKPYDCGAVGVFEGVDVTSLPDEVDALTYPWTRHGKRTFRSCLGTHRVLVNGGDKTATGEGLGITYATDGTKLTDASQPDFNGFVPFPGDRNQGYLYTAWEQIPAAVSRLHLQNTAEGWTVLGGENLDLRPVEGLWNTCFGTVSPWGTPLLSEEYEPPAANWYAGATWRDAHESVERYLGRPGNPYRYGWIVEVTDPLARTPGTEKRFALGRFSHENAVVMPDQRTVYLSDDAAGGVLFKFVADSPGDLTAGTLFAARLTQDSGSDSGRVGFDVEWVRLAHGTEREIASWVTEYDGQGTGGRYITRKDVQEWAAGNRRDDRAAFLESRRAAVAKGATAEWNKMEGINVRPGAEPGDFLYIAVSSVQGTMLSNEVSEANARPRDEISLNRLPYGVLYCAQLDGDFDISRIEPAAVGSRTTFWGPDNIVVLPDGRVLIGEDGPHAPNQLWLFDPDHR
ncbi:PhoX family protein [Haloarchaeobius sp. HME9146]|uniref:PhoX family protein n=1 Tax=Haloarchaeobius sp. HME9146 TaxID=2978732 RepID=UPI0021C05F88|nr:PhoX family protein [Haloarchaeobius sp. HME9146]MCT9096845.1 PhoX family protein [Haloarchaeobius sp. HME9146]